MAKHLVSDPPANKGKYIKITVWKHSDQAEARKIRRNVNLEEKKKKGGGRKRSVSLWDQ